MSLFERDDILEALRELARRLADAGVVAGVRIVGGAALAIEYFDRAATHDVDAFLSPADDVKAVAAELARDRGWPEDWLNDKVLMCMSHHDEQATWKPIVVEPGVLISVASADLLLAMKLLAGRGNRDGDDIEQLLGICGVNSIESADEVFDRYYPQHEIAPRARRRTEAWLARR